MPSIIEGYTYDIFISYRQNDNKYDGWVTEFVDNLNKELEANIKDKISVYFDVNPHDGLLETHSVNLSLEEKLRCLIFIPIMSRTYCDPKSFAWQHEFCEFNKLAKEDKFGSNIRLASGNVAGRILPVKIHDLDAEDKVLLEDELGGVLRSVDFIYKSAGVNRPLRANEDHPHDNLNKTYYRDQINKVANAVKEIIASFKKYGRDGKVAEESLLVKTAPGGKSGLKTIAGILLILALISTGYFLIPGFYNSSGTVENSIAVLPFKLLSDEPDKQYIADGMMDAILMHLQKFKDLKVISRTSVEQYRGSTKSTRDITHELEVGYLLEGSFQKHGDQAKLIVQLINSNEDSHAWANEYNISWKEVFSVQSEIAQTIASELHMTISPEEKALVEKVPTHDLEAYDLYMKALEYDEDYKESSKPGSYHKALTLYRAAIEIDSAFGKAYTGLARIYYNRYRWETFFKENYLDTCLKLVNKALLFDNKQEDAYYLMGLYYLQMANNELALENFDKALEINPNYFSAYSGKGNLLTWKQYNFISGIENYNIALTLIRGKDRPDLLILLGRAYLDIGFVEKARSLYREAFLISGEVAKYNNLLSWLEFTNENYEEALRMAKKSNEADSSSMMDLVVYIFPSGHEKDAYDQAIKLIEMSIRTGSLTLNQNHRIGYALFKAGKVNEADDYFKKQIRDSEEIIRLKRVLGYRNQAQSCLAQTYAFLGEKEKAYKNLEALSTNDFYPLWQLSILRNDPMYASIRNEERFQEILKKMELKYQAEHNRVRKWLEENNML